MMIRVLIADDLSRVRVSLAELLSLYQGINVIGAAANGTEAVEMAASQGPDIVIMDMKMPGLSGLEAARQIKNQENSPAVVIYSLFDDPRSRKNAERAGVDMFIHKGERVSNLLETVRTLAGRKIEGQLRSETGDADHCGEVEER